MSPLEDLKTLRLLLEQHIYDLERTRQRETGGDNDTVLDLLDRAILALERARADVAIRIRLLEGP